jgi:hypothetical protein
MTSLEAARLQVFLTQALMRNAERTSHPISTRCS